LRSRFNHLIFVIKTFDNCSNITYGLNNLISSFTNFLYHMWIRFGFFEEIGYHRLFHTVFRSNIFHSQFWNQNSVNYGNFFVQWELKRKQLLFKTCSLVTLIVTLRQLIKSGLFTPLKPSLKTTWSRCICHVVSSVMFLAHFVKLLSSV
jgi:hypothetical protein